MSAPDWWEAVLLALAAARVWRLAATDTVLDKPRAWLLERSPQIVDDWLECPWCSGFWITVGWWGCWQAWPQPTLAVAAVFALSLAVGVASQFGE